MQPRIRTLKVNRTADAEPTINEDMVQYLNGDGIQVMSRWLGPYPMADVLLWTWSAAHIGLCSTAQQARKLGTKVANLGDVGT